MCSLLYLTSSNAFSGPILSVLKVMYSVIISCVKGDFEGGREVER